MEPTPDSPRRPVTRLGAALRARVTAADVGQRVTIRRLVPGDDGRPVPSDVLGHLLAFDDDHLEVERRDGTRVRINAATVVASKVIPPAPPRRPRATPDA